ncbi:MAG: FkbM family methyltransferase [Erythrobacter sp.]|nr:FkbM family methyltransferase [Erythrobacter sp.]
MAPNDDPFWQAAASHVAELGLPAGAVFAGSGFQALLPGCRTIDSPLAPDFPAAFVLHKGRLDEVPSALLLAALDRYAVSFANEVFLVLSQTGSPVAADNPHVPGREALLTAAIEAHERKPAAAPPLQERKRMPAVHVGQGRVLLESAFGHLMLVNGGDTAIVPHLIRDGFFDRNLTNVIDSMLVSGMTFIDIGANCGTYTIYGAARVGREGRVIAIEAAPAISALLQETVAMNGAEHWCEVLGCAAGAEPGTLVLHTFASRQGGNTVLPEIADVAREALGETVETVEIPCRTLDDIVAERDLSRIDLIKIDVEGFEREVLLGGRATLMRYRPKLIIEWHNAFFDKRPGSAQVLYDLLTTELRYSLHRIEQGATTRPVVLDDLRHGHADLVALPLP